MGRLEVELKRKAFHFLSAAYALCATLLPWRLALGLITTLFVMEGTLEAVRLRSPQLNTALLRLFGGIHRPDEARRFSGIFWTLAGASLTLWAVPDRRFAVLALWYLAFGDGLAGLAGTLWGRHPIGRGPKTWEGTGTCFLSALITGVLFLGGEGGWALPFFGAAAASLAEWLPLPWNDNLWVPVLSGAGLYGLSMIVG